MILKPERSTMHRTTYARTRKQSKPNALRVLLSSTVSRMHAESDCTSRTQHLPSSDRWRCGALHAPKHIHQKFNRTHCALCWIDWLCCGIPWNRGIGICTCCFMQAFLYPSVDTSTCLFVMVNAVSTVFREYALLNCVNAFVRQCWCFKQEIVAFDLCVFCYML